MLNINKDLEAYYSFQVVLFSYLLSNHLLSNEVPQLHKVVCLYIIYFSAEIKYPVYNECCYLYNLYKTHPLMIRFAVCRVNLLKNQIILYLKIP